MSNSRHFSGKGLSVRAHSGQRRLKRNPTVRFVSLMVASFWDSNLHPIPFKSCPTKHSTSIEKAVSWIYPCFCFPNNKYLVLVDHHFNSDRGKILPSPTANFLQQMEVCQGGEESCNPWQFREYGQGREPKALDPPCKSTPNLGVDRKWNQSSLYHPSRGQKPGCLEGSKLESLMDKNSLYSDSCNPHPRSGQLAGGLSQLTLPGQKGNSHFNPDVFSLICQKWRTPKVYILAFRCNKKLPVYAEPEILWHQIL